MKSMVSGADRESRSFAYLRFLNIHHFVWKDVLDDRRLNFRVVHPHGLIAALCRLCLFLLRKFAHFTFEFQLIVRVQFV